MEKIKFTAEDIQYCSNTLGSWRQIVTHLSNPKVTEADIYKLIYYEALTKRRKDILNRLFGRYFKLCRQREWERLMEFISEKEDEQKRKEYRDLFN